ncbi:MAG: undecaprenyldiphospho-muramoylpentapeptide beta-N-acetylglucosaminyltransferase [Treponema sp.]|jgi:UDP-N-acetylglucosamine--N-acetylmuramyl-(pentapeptide) pyrophosphoryl-undecaprenol N-acetylglucosamine transferase|nr:undecaprenyldiphospho-muramoylpentapeptide beta-N-acetylglucosaminyltransferase [Treponema sp.]
MVTIAFTGGGTGGHIYPGLAIIESLKEKFPGEEYKIIWIGSNAGMDRSIVEGAGLEFFGIPAGKLRRYFTLKTIPDAFKVAAGFFASRRILKKQKVNLLFSKGGFVSVPPCAAAASLGIPVFTHESDFSPGLATRLNLRFVRKTKGSFFIAYEDTARFLAKSRLAAEQVIVSGNPVRSAFRRADPAKGRAFLGLGRDERVLLVLGGSQGARELNTLVRGAIDDLRRHYTVVHQYGPAQDWDLPRAQGYIPFPYIKEEMPHVLAAAELVVGRSGAGTVWESAALGKPMVLIPLCGSGTRGDQVENARFFERQGAAMVLVGDEAKPETLSRAVSALAQDPSRREAMANAAMGIGSLNAAAIISDCINGYAKSPLR